MQTMVVQFGLATIPFGMRSSASALTSGTTSGQSGSMRQAEELSITMAPAAATFSANSRDADGAHGEQGDVDAAVVGGGHVLDDDAVEDPPGRAGAGEQAQPVVRKAAGPRAPLA